MCLSANTSALQQAYYPPAAYCAEFMIPVAFEAETTVFAFPKWDDDYALEDFLAVATTRPSAMLDSLITGTKTETATRQIAASFCTPKHKNGKEKTVILATHGIGQARSHWYATYSDLNKYLFNELANIWEGILPFVLRITTLSNLPSQKGTRSSSTIGSVPGFQRSMSLYT